MFPGPLETCLCHLSSSTRQPRKRNCSWRLHTVRFSLQPADLVMNTGKALFNKWCLYCLLCLLFYWTKNWRCMCQVLLRTQDGDIMTPPFPKQQAGVITEADNTAFSALRSNELLCFSFPLRSAELVSCLKSWCCPHATSLSGFRSHVSFLWPWEGFTQKLQVSESNTKDEFLSLYIVTVCGSGKTT